MSGAMRAACGLVLASLVAMAVAAQGVRPQFGLGVGATFPIGDYHADANGDGFNPGWQGMALVDFRLPNSGVGIRVDGSYGQNSANDKLNADLTTVVGQPTTAKTKLLGGNVDLTYQFRSSSPVKLYVLGGVGVYNVRLSVTSNGVTADTSETKFAWNAGAGFTYGLGGVALFLEARYFDVAKVFNVAKTSFVPIVAGVRFGGM